MLCKSPGHKVGACRHVRSRTTDATTVHHSWHSKQGAVLRGCKKFRTSMSIEAMMPTIASADAMQMHLVMFHSSGIGLVCTCPTIETAQACTEHSVHSSTAALPAGLFALHQIQLRVCSQHARSCASPQLPHLVKRGEHSGHIVRDGDDHLQGWHCCRAQHNGICRPQQLAIQVAKLHLPAGDCM